MCKLVFFVHGKNHGYGRKANGWKWKSNYTTWAFGGPK
jgi:hypothetical protein